MSRQHPPPPVPREVCVCSLGKRRGGGWLTIVYTSRRNTLACPRKCRATNAEARLERAEEEASRDRGLRATAESSLEACAARLEVQSVRAHDGRVGGGGTVIIPQRNGVMTVKKDSSCCYKAVGEGGGCIALSSVSDPRTVLFPFPAPHLRRLLSWMPSRAK